MEVEGYKEEHDLMVFNCACQPQHSHQEQETCTHSQTGQNTRARKVGESPRRHHDTNQKEGYGLAEIFNRRAESGIKWWKGLVCLFIVSYRLTHNVEDVEQRKTASNRRKTAHTNRHVYRVELDAESALLQYIGLPL